MTSLRSSRRLLVVHRSLALLLIAAVIATPGISSWLHTHAYDGHDHPEHHHGLAAHQHHVAHSRTEEGTAHLGRCDPGMHVVHFVYVCATPPQVQGVDAELRLPDLPVPQSRIQGTIRHADLRAHAPPPRTDASPRAPPLIGPA